MQLLTKYGYKNIEDCVIGEELIAYDINDGHLFTNFLESKTQWTHDMLPAIPPVYELDEEGNIVHDEDGNPIILEAGKTSEEVFQETYGDWKFYKINDTWVLYCNQSVWANMNVVHASELQIGDIIYDDQDQDVVITSIEEVESPNWWRLQVSGDHSYISDSLTMHNASRYWVGGGASSNWNATGNTNWGSTSGGSNNASVPASTDDVTFDGAGASGNTNSTISATITILSLNITTGYTSTMTHNAVLTIAGNWTYTGNYVISGSSGISITGNSTITSNGVTWPNSLTVNSSIFTLSGSLTIGGVLSTSSGPTINQTTTESLILYSGITHGHDISGTAKIVLKGGTWTSSNSARINNNLDFDGNVTMGSNTYYATGTMTYVSGTVTLTSNTMWFQGSCTLNTNGISWNAVSNNGNAKTITLTSNLTINGLFTNNNAIINKTASETVTLAGGITAAGSLDGTAKVILTGGTWTGASNTSLKITNPLDINGNITLSSVTAPCYGNSVITYVSGTVTTTGSTLNIVNGSGATFKTSGMSWNNIYCYNSVITLGENLILSGSLGSDGATWNTTTTQTITANGLTVYATSDTSGSASIILTGGTWIATGVLRNNLTINGNVTVSGNVRYRSGTLTYQSGTVTTTGSTLEVTNLCTLNTNGITWNNITFSTIGGTQTLLSNLSCSGLLTISVAITLNTSVSATVTSGGGLTVNAALSGTAKVILTGGTWSGSGSGVISNNLDINGNVTISGTVQYTGAIFTYISGTVTTTGSTVRFNNTATITSGSIVWDNVNFENPATTRTLSDNFTVNGLLTVSSGGTITVNKTTNENLILNGGITMSSGSMSGTAKIILSGGTWSGPSTGSINNSLDIQGNVTISGVVRYSTGVLTYVNGTVTTAGSTLTIINGTTFNTNGIIWNNVTIGTNGATHTLTSDFTMTGLLTISINAIINKTTSETWTTSGGMTLSNTLSGTSKVILTGGTWSGSSAISTNLDINGNVTVSGVVNYATGTLTYVSGTITTTGSTLGLGGGAINTNGITWNKIDFNINGSTITLTSNLSCSGLVTTSVTSSTLNRTTSETLTTGGGLSLTGVLTGTADVYLTGGTWSSSGANGVINNNLFIQGDCTVSGTVYKNSNTITYISGTVTVTGSTLLIGGITISTNGMTWNNVTFNSSSKTITLSSNFLMSGLLTVSGITTLNTSVGSTWTISGGLTMSNTLSGTAKVILTGGTWSGSSALSTNLDIKGNVTVSGFVTYLTNIMTYVSGTVTTTGSTIQINGNCTLNTNGITWNNFNFSQANTTTLTSNLSIGGLVTVIANTTLNKTTSETATLNGGITSTNGTLSGTADVYLTGGTWSYNAIRSIQTNLFINGNITISGSVSYASGTLTYLSGIVTVTGSTLNIIGSCTLNTSGMTWDNVTFITNSGTHALTSNFACSGLVSVNIPTVINTSVGATFTSSGGLTMSNTVSGTAKIILTGGTWSANNALSNNLDINGNITISGNVYYKSNTLTYLSGKVINNNAILNITASSSIINFNKVPLNAVLITSGQTITMNQFFTGVPSRACAVSSTGANYTISFTDGFEKIAKYVSITGATIARSNQLLVINNSRFNTNRSTNNQGIRYTNQSPNGISKGSPSIVDAMTTPMLLSDPCFQYS